ncbi:MAG: CinA family nicotinamide mononucleotide deamidase-related protein [Bacteroidales bacterium]|nr:CinA family nicotinamide mononucleotide deamidase-related protein [Bacteroidales bacterium]
MRVRIVVIGDEILLGRVTDTNSGMLARMLDPLGWKVTGVTVVGDDADRMHTAISSALDDADIVLTTGGLGPTRDDITKQVLAGIFGGGMRHDTDVLANAERIMNARGLKINDLTRTQAIVPESATVIQNPCGTAPVMMFSRAEKTLVAMPGVPFETRAVFPASVLPALMERYPSAAGNIEHRTLMLTGITESGVAEILAPWEDAQPQEVHLAYLPSYGVIRLRVDTIGPRAAELADKAHAELAEILKQYVFATDDVTPAECLLRLLGERGLKVATAESCTGGNIAHTLTLIPGSSASVQGGVVSYANDVKTDVLGVSADTLAAHGAVSIPVAEQMARGAARVCHADVGIATTGIAGPGGATPGKPVGTVCIAVSACGEAVSHTYHFPGERSQVIDRATQSALLMAIRQITR